MFNLDELGLCPLLSKTLRGYDKWNAEDVFKPKSAQRWKIKWRAAHNLAILCPMKYEESLALINGIICLKKKGSNVRLRVAFKD